MFSALVAIAHVCRGNIATNATAIAVPSVSRAVVAFPEFPISAYRARKLSAIDRTNPPQAPLESKTNCKTALAYQKKS